MDVYAFLSIAILTLGFIGVPIGVGLIFYFIPKRLGYPQTAKYLAIAYALIVFTIVFRYYFGERKQTLKNESAILLADREAPLGRVYLRIFSDSTFEFESRGLERSGDIYGGKAKITADSIFFYYQDSIPKAGSIAVYSDKYVAYVNGVYPERLEISSSNLIGKKHN